MSINIQQIQQLLVNSNFSEETKNKVLQLLPLASSDPEVLAEILKILDQEIVADEKTISDLEAQADQAYQAAEEVATKVEEFLQDTNLRMDEFITWLDDQERLQQLQNSLKE